MTEPGIWDQKEIGGAEFTSLTGEKTLEGVAEHLSKQVTELDISNDPGEKLKNPVIEAQGIPIFNKGYAPGRIETLRVPEGGLIRFLTKPTVDNEEGVHNWYVEVLDSRGNPLGSGHVSTKNQKGSIITAAGKDGKKRPVKVFRSKFLVR